MLSGYNDGECLEMPRRNWRPTTEAQRAKYQKLYPCPANCPVHERIDQLFGVFTEEIVDEYRTNRKKVPLADQMIDGREVRALIANFLSQLASAIQTNRISEWPELEKEYNTNRATFISLALGCLADLCFNMEYIRRITDTKWAYCDRDGQPRLYYSYLGVCPRCVLQVPPRRMRPEAGLLASNKVIAESILANSDALESDAADIDEPDAEEGGSEKRYFGNKIQSHLIGRVGERILTLILDLVIRSYDPQAISGLIYDDQHEVDSIFISEDILTLVQMKASPLVLLPVVHVLSTFLTDGSSPDTGLPLPRKRHTLTDLTTAESELALYFALDDSFLPLGKRERGHWPYTALRKQLSLEAAMKILNNWFTIYRAFEVPKKERQGEDVKKAYLTCGWGAPIDDNKAKAGLARSDNMMKGTYASLKYGAYYVHECIRHTVRASLVANIDPVHQYEENLQKLEDIRWGHDSDFTPLQPVAPAPESIIATQPEQYVISANDLTNLFDSIFTFNRQILNDEHLVRMWDLGEFARKLFSGVLTPLLDEWRQLPVEVRQDQLLS